MLTIENILKLEGRPLADGWTIQLIYEATHNNCYVFELVKDLGLSGFTTRHKIMLERTGHRIFGQPDLSYFFIFNSKRTNVCVSADFISDKDNMISELERIVMNREKL
jgi:hypothetical protein